jgi:hypothetical protein
MWVDPLSACLHCRLSLDRLAAKRVTTNPPPSDKFPSNPASAGQILGPGTKTRDLKIELEKQELRKTEKRSDFGLA